MRKARAAIDGLVFCAPATLQARELAESIQLHMENSWKIERSGWPGAGYPEATATKSIKVFGAWLLLPIIENQL